MNDLQKIATLASKGKRVTKNNAFDLVRGLIDNEGRVSDATLASLYSFFLPAVPKKPKTPEQWVALAMAKNDVRYYLNYIYSDGMRLMATDGNRVHVFATATYPEGYYDSQLSPVEVDGKFPDITRVIPSGGLTTFTIDSVPEVSVAGKSPIHTVKQAGSWFQKRFFDEAVSGLDAPTLRRAKHDARAAILVESGACFAVIMPIRP